MPSYSVLQCWGPDDYLVIGSAPEVEGVESWISGDPILTPIPEPLEFEADPDEPLEPKELYNMDVLLMSDRLVAALQEAGVDNLQVYRALIRAPESRRTWSNYAVVNVVGAVQCADLTRSEYVAHGPPIIDVDFDSLVIDEEKAGGQLMFRLAEDLTAILVHDRVKDHLLARGFDMLTFQDPADFVG